MKPQLRLVPERPLETLAQAEKRIKQIEPRDFTADPWMRGEGAKFWTVERIAELKSENEALRRNRRK